MKNLFIIVILLFSYAVNAQIRINTEPAATISNQSVFLDAGGSGFNSSTNNGKGLAFPRTDLTTFQFAADGNAFSFATRYDGMIVYNTAAGNTITAGAGVLSGVGSQAVTPGFYYFSNPTSATVVGNGSWLAVGGGASTAMAISDGVAVDSRAIVNGTQEKVVRLATIAADGVNTTLDLHAALTTAVVTVAKFRKAAIYNAAGDLVMHATGGYTTGTDILVTGNGMMNKLLPAGTYSVEVYYTE